jgi:hypothetical protein
VAIIGKSLEPEAARQAKSVAVACYRLPETFLGKEHVCHRLPPVAEVPLSEKERVDLLAPQDAESCEPEGPQDSAARLWNALNRASSYLRGGGRLRPRAFAMDVNLQLEARAG